MKLRLVSTLAVAAMMLAAVALPAAADHAGVGAFTGNAAVGETFDNDRTPRVEGCPNGAPEARGHNSPTDTGVYGQGLQVPNPNDLGGISGVWALSTTVTGAPLSGLLEMCGELDENALGVGASCGMSEGSGGRGTFAGTVRLSDVGWTTSAGGTLPVTGRYTTTDGHTGTVLALTQAQGGSGCIAESGATSFAVVGVTSLIPVDSPTDS